jgi:hypothetical protein
MPDYTYNPSTRSYERDGQSTDPRDVRSWVREAVDASKESVRQAAEAYRKGDINLPQLVITIREEMVSAQTAASVIARGGRERMDASMWGGLGSRIREANTYLRSFERDLANGVVTSDGLIASRAEMYVSAASAVYENEVRARETDAGMAEESRELGAANNCDDCLSAASQGWQPIGTLPDIGDSACIVNCNCAFVYR